MKGLMGLLLAACLALASAHHGHDGAEEHCHCGVFATEHEGLVELDEFPHEHVADCSKVDECKTVCQRAWRTDVGGGDLNALTSAGITVGQEFCSSLQEDGRLDFGPNKVHGYSSICHGPLLYDDLESQQELCCSGGVYEACA